MTKAREIAELGQKLTVDGSGNLDIAGDINTQGFKVADGTSGQVDIWSDAYNIQGGSNFGDMRFNAPRFRFYEDSSRTFELSGGNAYFFGSTVFNEDGADQDFRVETDTVSHMLFVDAGLQHVNIATSTDLGGVFNVAGQMSLSGVGGGTRRLGLLAETDTYNGAFALQAGGGSAGYGGGIVMYGHSHATKAGGIGIGISANSNGSFRVNTHGTDSGTDVFKVESNGDIGLYTNPLIQTNSSNGSITMQGGATNGGGTIVLTGGNSTSDIVFKSQASTATPREVAKFAPTEAVFNETGADIDFRVESDSKSHMLFVDAGGDHVNIGTSSDRGGVLNVYGTGTPIAVIESESDGTVLSLRTTDTDANHGPSLELYRNATGAAGDNLGSILIKGTDASAQDQVYFSIGTQISAAGNGVEASTVYIQNAHSGSLRERITIGTSAIVINQEGLDTDFRVEGDANSNLFFVDAGFNSGQGAIGIGTGSPSRASGFGGNQTVLHMAGCSVPEIRLTSSTSGQGDLSIFAHNSGAGAKIVNANGGIELSRGGTNQLTVSNGVVINEDSYDYDFRIESDNSSHAFFIDAGVGKICINNSETRSQTGGLTIYTSDGGNQDYWDQAKSSLVLAGYPSNTAGRGTGLSFYNETNDFHNGFITVTNSVNYNYYTEMAFGVLKNGTNLKTHSAQLRFTPWGNTLYVNADNTFDLGMAALRWKVVYAGTGTINTSDENEKQDIRDLNQAELNVATALKGMMKAYRWRDAVAEKGDDARIHVGVIAQDVEAAFAAEGLDAHRYGMFCEDTWMEKDGEHQKPLDEEGNYPEGCTERTRLGVRYDQILAFVIAAL